MHEETHSFSCPYCGETITMLLDFSVTSQNYIEDCEICCRPIEITYSIAGDELQSFKAIRNEE